MLPIVPVKVINSQNNLSKEVCALLDSGSSYTFCTDYVAQALNAAGRMCTYNLSTIEVVKQKQSKIVKLIVTDVNNNIKINQPNVFTKPLLNKTAIGLQYNVDKYPHLRNVTLPVINKDEIHLLIGQDTPTVLDMSDKREGPDGISWTSKSKFGRVLHGLTDVKTHEVSANVLEISLERQLECLRKTEGKLKAVIMSKENMEKLSL